jgi:Mitosis protein DIM1
MVQSHRRLYSHDEQGCFLGWQVDQAIITEEDKVVIIRFGHDWVSRPNLKDF